MTPLIDWRNCCQTLAVAAAMSLSSGVTSWCVAQEPDSERNEIETTTCVYKTVNGLDVKVDVKRVGRAGDAPPQPVVVWIHGGALIMGHRAGIDRKFEDLALSAGYALVSIDYRLAPETLLPAIIDDVQDAFNWLRGPGARQFNLDPMRLAVAGGSAGGYLTLVTGYRIQPRPRALIVLWGYGDLVGDWYSQPSHHARHHQSQLAPDEARRQVSGPPISDARDRNGNGGAFYQFCRQRGIWPQEVTGWDPRKEWMKFVPYMPVRNVTAEFPPTFLVHGMADTDVPYEQSVMMASEFKKHGVAHEFLSIPDAEHGLAGGNPDRIRGAYQAAIEFVVRHAN